MAEKGMADHKMEPDFLVRIRQEAETAVKELLLQAKLQKGGHSGGGMFFQRSDRAKDRNLFQHRNCAGGF